MATQPVPPPAAARPPAYTLVADPSTTWKPHRCHATVWPIYDEDYEDDDQPILPPDPADQVSDGDCEGGCGATLDDKLAAINRTRRDEGVCDTRRRDGLELALARLAPPTPDPDIHAWDRKTPLAYTDRVRDALALTPAELKMLATTGFVVPERLAYADFTRAYYDIHRAQLPVYVSADSIMHAVYASHDELLANIERERLAKHLDRALGAMHCGLPAASKQFPVDVANDLDLYLTVARSLLAGTQVPSELGKVDGMVTPIVDAIAKATVGRGTVEMFGRKRSFDTTQYTPRGHYVGDASLEAYFRAAMWVSRTELNLVSRDNASSTPGYATDTRETPREVVDALALAELVERTRARGSIDALDQAWRVFGGAREDVPLDDLARLRVKAKIRSLHDAPGEIAARLRLVIGDRYPRTTNIHPMANVPRLPVIATLIGPRVTPDMAALNVVLEERGPEHRAAELGYMLGHDRALAYVDRTPELVARLARSRDALIHAPVTDDLYTHWLEAIRGLAHRPAGAMPSFTDGTAYQDLRLDGALAAYGQLRHNHVLVSAQLYDQGGCEIPDGYVEPALATYTALVDYARLGRATFRALDPKDATRGGAYFTRLERLMRVLVALSREELANRPLSPAAKRFLAMIVERREASAMGYMGTFPVATYDGWYVDLFPQIDTAKKHAAFVADYATFDRNGRTGIHYLGAHGPRLGVFAVDVGGTPRMMVGPVATAFQHVGPLARRLTDDDAPGVVGEAPWAASYTARAVGTPPQLTARFARGPKPGQLLPRPPGPRGPDALPYDTLRLDAAATVGKVTVELLDHHFVKMATLRIDVPEGRLDTKVPAQPRPIESLRIIAGDFQARMDLALGGVGYLALAGPSSDDE